MTEEYWVAVLEQEDRLISKAVNINSFLTVAKKYTSFETLTPGMLHELVEKSWCMRVTRAAAIAFKKLTSIILSLATWRPLMWSPNELLKIEKQRDILSYITLQFFHFKKVPLEHCPFAQSTYFSSVT